MKSYEYFQETVESISDNNWAVTLKKHGNQGWELCTINPEKTYIKRLSDEFDEKAEDTNMKMQTIYTVIFRRVL